MHCCYGLKIWQWMNFIHDVWGVIEYMKSIHYEK
jgi:hypothetical protein